MELAGSRIDSLDRPTTRQWRLHLFRALAAIYVLLGFFILEGVTEGLMPWTTLGCPGCTENYNPEVHRWHGAEHGAMIAILFSGSMLALALKPRERPLLLQFYVLGFTILSIGFVSFSYQDFSETNPGALIFFIIALSIIVAAYPWFSQFKSFTRELSTSIPLLALTVASGLVLAPQIWDNLNRQIDGSAADEHAASGRWVESVIVMTVLIVAGLLASTRRPGWATLGTLIGIAYIYLGVSAITVPDQPGSWGTLGGAVAVAGGLAYLGLTYRESRTAGQTVEGTGESYAIAG